MTAGGEDEGGPGSVVLLGLVAYGKLAAFTQLAADARSAPDLAGRIELALLAATEMAHFGRLREHLAARGVDVLVAMAPFCDRVDAVRGTLAPSDWPETLVAIALGRGLVVDLQAEVLEGLAGEEAELVREVTDGTGHATVVEDRIRSVCTDPQVRARLSLWARRLLGEALAAVTAALDDHPDLAAVVERDAGASRPAVLKRLKSQHNRRVSALGL